MENLEKVFILDKIEFISTLIDLALTQEGIYTFTHSEPDCVHFIKDLGPQVLILDMETLKDDHKEFFKAIKSDAQTSQIPILGFGFSGSEKLIGESASYLNGFLAKPIEIVDIKQRIINALDGK